jgi:adenylosuccinate synthase
MTKKIYVTTDIGLGEAGKTSVNHWLVSKFHPHTIIRRGGGHGHHVVVTARGEKFAFRNWGCGTFAGVPTHISDQFSIHLEIMRKEADWLRYEYGLDPFSMLTVDERALMAHELHMVASRLEEMSRGKNPRGTIGTGNGVASRIHQKHPELSIYAGDISNQQILRDKLLALREYLQEDLRSVLSVKFLQEDLAEKEEYEDLLYNDGLIDFLLDCFGELAENLKVVPSDYMASKVLTKPGVAVVEQSHGVLGDSEFGFKPHVSAIRTVPKFANDMLRENGFGGKIVNLAVTRAYGIRCYPGPMPTHDPTMKDLLLPDSKEAVSRFAENARVGPLDIPLLRYAIDACGGPSAFDGLCITWFDRIVETGIWRLCREYENLELRFDPSVNWTQRLFEAVPKVSEVSICSGLSRDEYFDIVAQALDKAIGVPVRMVSFGPTERDKAFK